MKSCKRCKVKVNENTYVCPLCKTVLNEVDTEVIEPVYPTIEKDTYKYNIIRKIFIYLFVIGSTISIAINFIIDSDILWSAIYIVSVFYLWMVITNAFKNNSNIANKLFIQLILILLFIIIIDLVMGYKGWSLNYVVPGIILTSNIAFLIVNICNLKKWHEYVLYQILTAFLGFIPLILFFCKITHDFLISLVIAIISFMIIGGIIIFSNKNVRSEFKRRFNF